MDSGVARGRNDESRKDVITSGQWNSTTLFATVSHGTIAGTSDRNRGMDELRAVLVSAASPVALTPPDFWSTSTEQGILLIRYSWVDGPLNRRVLVTIRY